MLNAIERATRQKIEPLALPTVQVINEKRVARFKQKITDALAQDDLSFTRNLVEQYQQEHGTEALEVAAALAQMSIGDKPLLLKRTGNTPKLHPQSRVRSIANRVVAADVGKMTCRMKVSGLRLVTVMVSKPAILLVQLLTRRVWMPKILAG